MEEVALPREEHTKWLSCAKWSALKIHVHKHYIDLAGLIYPCINTRICMIAITVSEKEVINLKENEEGYMQGLVGKKGKEEI